MRVSGSSISVAAAFQSTDWNFSYEGSDRGAHSIHPFPAKFIPQIPRQVFRILNVPRGTIVLDPFAGSGTTLLEARLAGLNFAGVDLNPIAVLISRVKTSDLPVGAVDEAIRIALQARNRFGRSEAVAIPNIPRLSHWFTSENAKAMTLLRDGIEHAGQSGTSIGNFLRLCLSAITVRVSKQDNETRYAAVEKNVDADAVFNLFLQTARSVASKLSGPGTLFAPEPGHGSVFCSDSRRLSEIDLPPVSLVVTSPPYPNAFEYWLYNKYRMYWLGFDPVPVRTREIGARPHYSGQSGKSIDTFLGDMTEAFRGIRHHLVPRAYVVIIIGSRCQIRKTVHDVPPLLAEALKSSGYNLLARIERKIPRSRKVFNPEIGSIDSEAVMLFEWSDLC